MDIKERLDEAGLFGPESVSWQVNRETTVLFGGARAILMQAAHPLILAGARQTGFYERNPWKRLERTLRITYTITFGTRRAALDAVTHINQIHRDIHGIDEITGLPYDATDPELLLWVHACLVDSSLLFEELTVGRLAPEERERFHLEQMLGAELLGLPRSKIPPTVAALRSYIDEVVKAGTLRVTDGSLRVAALFRYPPRDVPWRPVLRLINRWAFGTLPAQIRSMFGVDWNGFKEFRMRAGLLGLKTIRPAIPSHFREVMPAREAARRVYASGP